MALEARGWRNTSEAAEAWPSVRRALERIALAVTRRNPAIDASADWLHRELASAPISEAMRAEAEDLIAKIKAKVAATAPSWRPSLPTRDRRRAAL